VAAIQAGMALAAGVGLGLFYFGGLWLTLRLLPSSRYAGLLVSGSLLLRVGVTLPGFYLVMGGQVERMAACLLGFILARVLLARRLAPGIPATQKEAADGVWRY
jgi:F1F0 ATPase subunit 2